MTNNAETILNLKDTEQANAEEGPEKQESHDDDVKKGEGRAKDYLRD